MLVGVGVEEEAGEGAGDIDRVCQDLECETEEMGRSGKEEDLLQPAQHLPGTPRPAESFSCWRECGKW